MSNHTTDPQRGADGAEGVSYTFITPNDHYELAVEERDDVWDTFCVTAVGGEGYDEWTSAGDLRSALGTAVMRIIRHETGDNCMCRACRGEEAS